MADKCSFMYDDFSDRLLISCKKKNQKVRGSIRLLNLIIDIGNNNKVINIELKKASDYLKSINVNPKILENLTGAQILVKTCRDGYLIYFVLETEKGTERIPYNIHSVKKPISIK